MARTALVTGCSAGGLGAALALALARHGFRVFATARSPAKVPPELAAAPGVTVLPLDVTSAPSIADAVRAVAVADAGAGTRPPGLDVLVNNAGVGYTMPLLDVDVDAARALYETNVWGPLRMAQAFAGLLVARGGRIVNVSSVGAAVNTPWIGAYASSKAALAALSETLRLEVAPLGVSVVTVMLGTVATPFHANEPVPELPAGSRYAAVGATVARWARGHAGPRATPVHEAAAALLPDVVGRGRGGLVWRAANSTVVRFVSRWVPASVADALISTGQGLDELARARRG